MILGVVGISGCTELSDQITKLSNQTNTYSKNNISFNYPYTWEEGDPAYLLKEEIVEVVDPSSMDKMAINNEAGTSVNVGTKSLSREDTLKSYYKNLVKQGHDYEDYKRVSNREFTLNGQPAYEIVYTCKLDGNVNGKIREVLTEINGKVYFITCVALVNDFNKNVANFDMIINSFKVQ